MRWNPTKEEHYYQILRVLEPWIPKKQLEAWMFPVILRFKRRDRIQYILMQIRFRAVLKLLAKMPRTLEQGVLQHKDLKKLQALYWKYFDSYTDPSQPLFRDSEDQQVFVPKFPQRLTPEQEDELWTKSQSEHEELEHLVDTMHTGHYQSALDVIWKNQPINVVGREYPLLIRELEEAIEQDRSEIQEQFILPEDVETYAGGLFVQCGDNFAWYALLTSPQRKIEAQLMNHCASPQHGIILSLREFVPQRGLRPHLTFEYIPNYDPVHILPNASPLDFLAVIADLRESVGILGEMKGYGNSKPTETYHEQIMCLLEAPNILAVTGGDYLHNQDFSLDDLSLRNKEELKRIKPELFDDKLVLTRRSTSLFRWLKKRYPKVVIVEDKLVDQKFDEPEEALRYIVDQNLLGECYEERSSLTRSLERLVNILENPGELEFWDQNYGDTQLSRFFENMRSAKHQHYYTKFKKLLEKVPGISEETLYYIENREWENISDDLLEIIQNDARSAESIGWETGTFSAISQILMGMFPVTTNRSVITKRGAETTPSKLFDALIRGEEEETSVSDESCQSIRRIIWNASEVQDFDEDAAFEFFLDRLGDNLPLK